MRIDIIIFFSFSFCFLFLLSSPSSSSFFPFSFHFLLFIAEEGILLPSVLFYHLIPTLTGSCTALSVARATCGEPTNDERIDKITYLIERVRFGSLAALLSSSFTALTLVRKPDPSIVESSLSRIVLLWRTTPSPRFQRSTLRGKYLSREEFFSSLSSFLMPGERREEKEEEKKRECDLSESSTVRQGNERTLE